jgi:hypothetical protein
MHACMRPHTPITMSCSGFKYYDQLRQDSKIFIVMPNWSAVCILAFEIIKQKGGKCITVVTLHTFPRLFYWHLQCVLADEILYNHYLMGTTVKLWFYNPRLYVFPEFTHFLHGSGQMPITLVLNFNGFYISTTLSFYYSSSSSGLPFEGI